MHESILLIEDEAGIRETLIDRLHAEGYSVESATDGEEGLEKASNSAFDLIILDVMLPRRNGLDVCAEPRKRGVATAILILTVRNETVDKVVGLRIGADDYVTKPFDAAELMARIDALLRRLSRRPGEGRYQFGSVLIDLGKSQVTRGGEPVYLTGREFQLLRYFVERAGSVIPREELLRAVWGYDKTTFTRTVDTHVRTIRQKLEDKPHWPSLILTISGVGYKLVSPTGK
jgi:two-component system, OmpR family, alkaline phosphatase synthesis response regulator PhoP